MLRLILLMILISSISFASEYLRNDIAHFMNVEYSEYTDKIEKIESIYDVKELTINVYTKEKSFELYKESHNGRKDKNFKKLKCFPSVTKFEGNFSVSYTHGIGQGKFLRCARVYPTYKMIPFMREVLNKDKLDKELR